MCNKIDCRHSQVFYCSKCILEDEKHIQEHKEHFQSIESYLPDRIVIKSKYNNNI